MKENREKLKSHFKKEQIPTEQQFANLIDSVPNIVEDGDVRFGKEGLTVFSKVKNGALLEMYSQEPINNSEIPCWKLSIDNSKNLIIKNGNSVNPVLTISKDNKIAIHSDLEISGIVKAENVMYFEKNIDFENVDGKQYVLLNYTMDELNKYVFIKYVISLSYNKKTQWREIDVENFDKPTESDLNYINFENGNILIFMKDKKLFFKIHFNNAAFSGTFKFKVCKIYGV